MTRKRITVLLLVVSLALTAVLIFGSFITYAEPISSTEMQNIYVARITTFGVAMLLLQLVCLIMAATDKRDGSPA